MEYNDYFIEDNYYAFTKNEFNNFTPESNYSNNLAIKPIIEYDERNMNSSQYITYINHPNIIFDDISDNKNDDSDDNNDIKNLNIISQIYFGSLTVIGLFIFFKLLQRS